jgi:DNA-binding NtrC family response regulator
VTIAPAAKPQPHMIGHEIPIAPAPPPAALALLNVDGEVRPIEEIETEVIRFAIAHYRGQMSEVARRLKIGRSTLYRKLETMDGNQAEPAQGD